MLVDVPVSDLTAVCSHIYPPATNSVRASRQILSKMIPMDGIEDLPVAHKEKLLETIERMQARDSLTLYNNVVARCFEDCVTEFRRRELDLGEEKCISKCAEKFMKHSQRVGVRFGELSSELEQKVQEQMQEVKK